MITIESRREFLKKGLWAGAGLLSFPLIQGACSSTIITKKEIGVQIYSVRNQLEKDFEGTIAALGDIGFSYIEAYGLAADGTILGRSIDDFKQLVHNNGMRIASTHCDFFTTDQAFEMIESARILETDNLIIPYLTEDMRNDYDSIAEQLDQIGKECNSAGIRFGYHNHDFEFFETDDGRIPMDILLQGTDPENVTFELDLYWVVKAGYDPMEVINNYPGRFSMFHVKDSDSDLNQTTVGTGIIDFQKIISESKKDSLKYIFVEDEREETPLKNVENAYIFLQSIDY